MLEHALNMDGVALKKMHHWSELHMKPDHIYGQAALSPTATIAWSQCVCLLLAVFACLSCFDVCTCARVCVWLQCAPIAIIVMKRAFASVRFRWSGCLST